MNNECMYVLFANSLISRTKGKNTFYKQGRLLLILVTVNLDIVSFSTVQLINIQDDGEQ